MKLQIKFTIEDGEDVEKIEKELDKFMKETILLLKVKEDKWDTWSSAESIKKIYSDYIYSGDTYPMDYFEPRKGDKIGYRYTIFCDSPMFMNEMKERIKRVRRTREDKKQRKLI